MKLWKITRRRGNKTKESECIAESSSEPAPPIVASETKESKSVAESSSEPAQPIIAAETKESECNTESSSEPAQTSIASELLPDIVREIGGFLEAPEAVRFSQTCRSISSDLSFTTHSSLATGNVEKTMYLRGGQHDGNPPICIGAIVPQYDDSFHSVTLKFKWKDQGRGRRKARLSVVAHDILDGLDALSENFEQSLKELPYKRKKVVYRSEFAHHRISSLQVTICPQPNKIYQIWCTVGSETSFSLSLKDISIHTAAFGNRAPTCAFYQFQQKRLPFPRMRQVFDGTWWSLVPELEPINQPTRPLPLPPPRFERLAMVSIAR
mmetsp:Transcript_2026/g.4569  ORF Transcript_2026/g.4569 Transcript_2026/m.4569 type:complete len:324 (-) Transcript_2026:153-1124(-)